MRGRGFGRHRSGSSWRVAAWRERCGQSSAATTSASEARRRPGPPPRRGRGSRGRPRPAVLAAQDEDAAQPDALGAGTSAQQVVADHRDVVTGGSRSPRSDARAPPTACRRRPATACRGRAPAARSRTRGRPRSAGVERGPSGVSHHGLRCIPSSSAPPRIEPEGAVEVVVGHVLGRVADRRPPPTVPGAGAPRPRRRSARCWPSNSRRGVLGGEDVERRGPGRRARCRRPSPTAPMMIAPGDVQAAAGRQRASVARLGRGVGHDAERDAARLERSRGPRPRPAAVRRCGR